MTLFSLSFASSRIDFPQKYEPVVKNYRVYLADPDNRSKEFRIDIPRATNPRGFRMFRSYVRDGVKLDSHGNPTIGVVIGQIIRAKPTKMHRFNFRFDSKTVRWNDFATQACDGLLADVENHLEEWLKLGQFCPWTTRSMTVRIVKNNTIIWKRPASSPAPEPIPDPEPEPNPNPPDKYSSSDTVLQEN